MVYLIYFEWLSTKGNHAGMAYLAKSLEHDISNVKAIKMISGKSKLVNSLNFFYSIFIAIYLRIIIKPNDKVFLMEYLARSCFQDNLARILRCLRVKNEITGLVHLSGNHLLEIYGSVKIIQRKTKPIDRIITLGSSLTHFFIDEVGFDNVVTTFHYTDTNYYKLNTEYKPGKELRVLTIGATKRDFGFLCKLVNDMPDIHFNICQGYNNLSHLFGGCSNVTLYGFLPEDELLKLMQNSDVNLSVMEDTIGSNVIVGGLSTGMIMVVSDVGSIRDYCTENESFLCNNEDDFIKALDYLRSHMNEIPLMKQKSMERGNQFSYNRFKDVFANCLFAG
jgi:glycosyltransferase involved in cell wall biosynthesis